jgi:hypothetical protein
MVQTVANAIKGKPKYGNYFKMSEKETVIYGSNGTICSSSDSEQISLHDVHYS